MAPLADPGAGLRSPVDDEDSLMESYDDSQYLAMDAGFSSDFDDDESQLDYLMKSSNETAQALNDEGETVWWWPWKRSTGEYRVQRSMVSKLVYYQDATKMYLRMQSQKTFDRVDQKYNHYSIHRYTPEIPDLHIPLCVMVSLAIWLNLGSSVFCRPHARENTNK